MFLSKLALLHFKNHEQRTVSFSKKVNCFIGNNGAGKTNLLDAIYYLCLTKSYFSSTDVQNILFGKDFFRLEGNLTTPLGAFHVVYKLLGGRKKELFVNDVTVPKLSAHIGHFPAVMIAPDDNQLVLGSSEERRRFIDATISQVNIQYLEWLILYNKFLAQRNATLKDFAEKKRTDMDLLESYNVQLHTLGTKIYEARQTVVEQLQPIFNYYYSELSLEREQVSFQYVSQLTDKPLDILLEETLQKDLLLQRTECGIHRDDLDFFIGNNKLKRFGSQGQQKSFIISLKLAQHQFISKAKGFHPLLLIDDIFDKLDNDRSRQLLHIILSDNFGQVFITDTDEQHILNELGNESEIVTVR